MTDSNKKLEIATKTITIKVIQVDGHKMTKSTFDQIPIHRDYNNLFQGFNTKGFIEFHDEKALSHISFSLNIFGWVSHKNTLTNGTRWILFIDNDKLLKFNCKGDLFNICGFNKLDQLYIAT